jgi:L-2,4-diaminobutyrate decarboxylase
LVDEASDFISLNKVDINSVVFMYSGKSLDRSIQKLNKANAAIHERILSEGLFHVHQFTISDSGFIKKGAVIQPLRYMNGNPNTTQEHLKALLAYIRRIGEEVAGE